MRDGGRLRRGGELKRAIRRRVGDGLCTKIDRGERKNIATNQNALGATLSVDERSEPGAEVLEANGVADESHCSVTARHPGVGNNKVGIIRAAHRVGDVRDQVQDLCVGNALQPQCHVQISGANCCGVRVARGDACAPGMVRPDCLAQSAQQPSLQIRESSVRVTCERLAYESATTRNSHGNFWR